MQIKIRANYLVPVELARRILELCGAVDPEQPAEEN